MEILPSRLASLYEGSEQVSGSTVFEISLRGKRRAQAN
jgi:hypothetical protein